MQVIIFRNILFVLLMLAAALFAGPKIEFDTKRFNCGTAIEGKADKINATFVVKNTGDAMLKLEKVRPGCGCTVVKYDTLIKPGKTAKIKAEVNITDHRGGALSKSITVTSNAENEPTVRLTIEATVQPIIDVSVSHLTLDKSNSSTPKTVILATKMSDLKVSDVSFKPSRHSQKPMWKAKFPLSIKHTWTPTDSVRTDGYRVFKMDMFSPNLEESISGEFIIKTNHPDKSIITVRGTINK